MSNVLKVEKKSESLMSPEKKCFVCGTTRNLQRHHVFYGTANRKRSEQYGCWVWLCGWHHNQSQQGVHFNKELDDMLKRTCQTLWERKYGTTEEFRAVFGKSWL